MIPIKWRLCYSTMSIEPVFSIGKKTKHGYVDIVILETQREMNTSEVLHCEPMITFSKVEDLFDLEEEARTVRDKYLESLNIELPKYEGN